jgi:hypothetical protein
MKALRTKSIKNLAQIKGGTSDDQRGHKTQPKNKVLGICCAD